MNFTLALFALSYIRAHVAVLATPRSKPELSQHTAPAPRRLRPSRRRLKRRATGAGAIRIDAGAGLIAQARGK